MVILEYHDILPVIYNYYVEIYIAYYVFWIFIECANVGNQILEYSDITQKTAG